MENENTTVGVYHWQFIIQLKYSKHNAQKDVTVYSIKT